MDKLNAYVYRSFGDIHSNNPVCSPFLERLLITADVLNFAPQLRLNRKNYTQNINK